MRRITAEQASANIAQPNLYQYEKSRLSPLVFTRETLSGILDREKVVCGGADRHIGVCYYTEGAMSNLDQVVLEEVQRAKILYAEWAARMQKLKAEGLVDCKMKLFVDSNTTTASVVMTLNNVLRLREAGKVRPLVLDVVDDNVTTASVNARCDVPHRPLARAKSQQALGI